MEDKLFVARVRTQREPLRTSRPPAFRGRKQEEVRSSAMAIERAPGAAAVARKEKEREGRGRSRSKGEDEDEDEGRGKDEDEDRGRDKDEDEDEDEGEGEGDDAGAEGSKPGRAGFVHAVTQRLVSLAIEELKQPDTIARINTHILRPLVRLIYAQLYPYLIVAAVVVLCALVMWVLMFLMFTVAYFRKVW